MNPQAVSVSYGALELKRAYQHNLLLGILFAAALHLAIVGAVLAYRALGTEAPPILIPAPPEPRVIDVENLPLPPPLTLTRISTRIPDALLRKEIGTLVAVDDADVTEEVNFPTRDDLAQLNVTELPPGDENGFGAADSFTVETANEYIPGLGEFVATEVMPVCIYPEPPVYPELARLAGQSATVVVSALVGLDGRVEDVRLIRASGSNAGFDEAALAAVAKNRYKPALQNGSPVRVWVTHRVEFRLR